MSAWTCRSSDGKAVVKIVPPRSRIPSWKGPGADSEEKHEPASDIDAALMESLKTLDPNRPIREADMTVCERPFAVALLMTQSGPDASAQSGGATRVTKQERTST